MQVTNACDRRQSWGTALTSHNITLDTARVGRRYRVCGISLPKPTERRLEALGMTEGTPLSLLNSKGGRGAMVIKVRGTRLAIGRGIASGIEISEVR